MSVAFPLTLTAVMFTRCVVISVPGHVKSAGQVEQGSVNTLSVAAGQGLPRQFSATMRSVLNEKQDALVPYHFDIVCMCNFIADETLSDEEAVRAAHVVGNSVLYGAIRETVAWLTGRQAYGSLILGLSVLPSAPAAAAPAAPSLTGQ